MPTGAWGGVVVKALRYKSEGPGIDSRYHRGFFPWHLTVSCALGSTQPLKTEYQVNPWGKGSRCVRLTTYHLHVPNIKKYGGRNLLENFGPVQACNVTASPLPLRDVHGHAGDVIITSCGGVTSCQVCCKTLQLKCIALLVKVGGENSVRFVHQLCQSVTKWPRARKDTFTLTVRTWSSKTVTFIRFHHLH